MDAIEVGNSLPPGLSHSFRGQVLSASDEVSLTITGIALVPAAAADLELLADAAELAASIEEKFEPATASQPTFPQLSSSDVAAASTADPSAVRRLYHLLQREPWFGGGGIAPDGWTCIIGREIRKFRGVRTFADYLQRRSEVFPGWPGSLPIEQGRTSTPDQRAPALPSLQRAASATTEGASLGPLPPRQRAILVRRVAEAVAEAPLQERNDLLAAYGLTASSEAAGRYASAESAVRASADNVLSELAVQVGLSELLTDWAHEDLNPWAPAAFRLFCSHLSTDQAWVAQLATELSVYGVSAFVAHRDIQPQAEWAPVIEFALQTADALIAIIGDGFERSHWCNQEVGWALGRGLLTASIRFAADPPGFVSRFQAIHFTGEARSQARLVFDVLVRSPKTAERAVHSITNQLSAAPSYAYANALLSVVATCPFWTSNNLKHFEETVRESHEVQHAYALPDAYDAIKASTGWAASADVVEMIESIRSTIPSYWQRDSDR